MDCSLPGFSVHGILQVLEKTLESPLDCRVIQPVHSEGDQPWDFFGADLPLHLQAPLPCKALGGYRRQEEDSGGYVFGRLVQRGKP